MKFMFEVEFGVNLLKVSTITNKCAKLNGIFVRQAALSCENKPAQSLYESIFVNIVPSLYC